MHTVIALYCLVANLYDFYFCLFYFKPYIINDFTLHYLFLDVGSRHIFQRIQQSNNSQVDLKTDSWSEYTTISMTLHSCNSHTFQVANNSLLVIRKMTALYAGINWLSIIFEN